MRKTCFALSLLALLMFAAIKPVQAQYPTRPIRFIVPFPPGGSADGIARIISQQMTLSMGQQWLVDNRPGADGALAGTIVMKAAPDGHTVFFGTNSPLSAVPALRKEPPYDVLRDFTPISLIGRFTFILFTSPSLPVKTLSELIDYARANPGKLNYGTGNTGGIVAMAQFKSLAKLDMVQIPYKGDAPTTADMLGGRIQLAFMAPIPALAQARDGRLRMLAVLMPQRSSLVPDVPTIGEAGMPGVSISPWTGMFGPARMPNEIVSRLSRELNAVLSRSDAREQIGRQGLEAQGTTPAALAAHTKEQLQAWTRIVREANIPQE